MMKSGLGTVQFGMNYGVFHGAGRVAPDEAERILRAAAAGGKMLDTAALYDAHERVSGEVPPESNPFLVTMKFPKLSGAGAASDGDDLSVVLERSLGKLRPSALYGVLFHSVDDLLSEGGADRMVQVLELQAAGLVRKVGVSVYTEDDVNRILDTYPIDIVQVPLNVFDQRLLFSGFLQRCKTRGVEVHARTVFLQGLLLMDPERLTAGLQPYAALLAHFQATARNGGANTNPLAAALAFVRHVYEADVIVCGVEHLRQFQQLLDGYRAVSETGAWSELRATAPAADARAAQAAPPFVDLAADDPGLLNPCRHSS